MRANTTYRQLLIVAVIIGLTVLVMKKIDSKTPGKKAQPSC